MWDVKAVGIGKQCSIRMLGLSMPRVPQQLVTLSMAMKEMCAEAGRHGNIRSKLHSARGYLGIYSLCPIHSFHGPFSFAA